MQVLSAYSWLSDGSPSSSRRRAIFRVFVDAGESGKEVAFSWVMYMVEELQHHDEHHQRGPCAPPMMSFLAVYGVRGAGEATKCGKSMFMLLAISSHA
jgi:hypothetical protein